ncbi:EGF-like domain protein (macronuclear) [Tetrahymena thermophila SB210]|uniref:EGF-like domain protein n=1 Tax=Tetrahymena thermophila (strain SB210) TaxID=312017 RepID=I7M3U9_TETTS|nr:EGF-like domain protein [Tetrahymena thermophila SB210]EAS04337.2 EGF-like domain protein [Tetrahymena thermophila SB210]|eukprot:XP_001024582.2 EGF-like domain protein [Tetrahymena thermophila SB210]
MKYNKVIFINIFALYLFIKHLDCAEIFQEIDQSQISNQDNIYQVQFRNDYSITQYQSINEFIQQSQMNLNQYQNQQKMENLVKGRILNQVNQIRLTANFDNILNNVPYYQTKLVKRAFRLVSYEISKILSIVRSSDTLKLEQQKCSSIVYSTAEYNNGIPQSDLHIYISKYDQQLLKQSEKVIICQYNNNQRASVGIISLDFSNYNIQDQSFLQSIIAQELFSQIYHLLGLNKDLIARFVDSKGVQITLDKIISTQEYQFSYNVLITNQIQLVSRQMFNCNDIEGILTEINLEKSIYFSKVFVNPQSLGADKVLSGRIFVGQIDLAFLKDTGFYPLVNNPYQQNESDQSLAYQKGCDFYKQLCFQDSNLQNFCSQDIKKCDNNHYGIAECNYFDSQIPCKIYQVVDINQFCFNRESNYKNDFNYYGNDSRCFESTLIRINSDTSNTDQARCLQNKCISNNTQIQIQFNSETLICSEENQKVVSVQNKGYIICPSNFEQFCQQNIEQCINNCSQNGLCINGKCECYPGYSGDYCQNINCVENNLFGCQQCSQDGSNICLKCYQGLYLSINKQECLQDCQTGQFVDQVNQQCKACQQGCKYCINNESCINCADNWYLNQVNQCVSKCPDGYFQEQIQQTLLNGQQISKWVCSKCHQACTTCFGYQINQCSECKKYYTLVPQNTCQHPKCDSNYYALNDKICIQCPSNCLSCTANEMCYRCENGFILINGKCQNSICKPGQIFIESTLKCEYCDEGCTQCIGKKSNCSNCQQNYYFWNNQCLQTCPYGFYKQLNPQNLSGNSNVQPNQNKQQIGMTSNYCSPCHQTCSDCIGPSQNDCSSCPPNYYLNVQDKSCKKSQLSNCIMALSQDVCLQCDAYYFLQNSKCQPNSCSPNFYALSVDNLQGFLAVQPSYKCLPCSYGCEACTNQNTCQQCSNGFQLDPESNQCILLNNSCLDGQYFDFQSQLCLDCSQNCLKCRDSNICLSCNNNYYLVNYSCQLPIIPPKTYYNSLLQQFLMCANPCSSCKDTNSCNYCYDPTDVLYQSQCIHQCPTGYFKQGNGQTNLSQCKQCDKTCLLCKDQLPTSCTVCQEGYEYYSDLSLCLPQCSNQFNVGLYYDVAQQKCVQCMKNCVKCQNQNTCTICQQGMFYDISQEQCSNCMDGCNICSDINTCQQCQVGMVYANQQCQKICTVKDLNCLRCDPITNVCLQCQSGQPVQSNGFCPVKCNLQNCQRCSSSTQCGECDDDYYLDINLQCQIKYCELSFCKQCNFDKYIPYCTKCQKEYLLTEDGTCSSKQCPQFGQQCQQCQNDNSCKICINGFYYSKEYNQCLSCPDKCSSCDQFQCFQYNTCPNGQYLFEKQCLNCFEQCQKCNGPNKSDCLDQELQQNCHYTCKECLGTDYNQCISCPENRILTFYYNVKYGECMCPYGTYDTLQIKCMEGHLDQIQRDLTIGFSYLGAVGVIAQSILSLNPAMFYLLSEFAQTLGQIQYINIKKAYDFDETVYALQHFNYNILSGVGSNVKPQEQKSTLRILEVRLEDLEKITSFYKTNNFLSNSEILILLNAACFSLMVFSNCLVHNETLKQYKNFKSVLRVFRFSLPAFMLVLTSSEMCVTIQLQMKKFDLDSGQVFALLLSIIFFTYQFVWIVIIIIQLGIKNSIRKKEHKLIFRIFNRKRFWQRIFLALLFVKKQFLSIILINVFKQPITLLFIQLITEVVFSIYIIVIKPYRGTIFKRFALLNQFTYIIVNIFLILISSNEDQQSETKPILYIFILSLILLVLVLYSIFSFYLIIKFVSQKVARNLTNRNEKTAILQKNHVSSITLRKTSTSENQVLNQIQEIQSQKKNQKYTVSNNQPNNFELVNIDQNNEQNTDNIFITNDCQINVDEEHQFQFAKDK